MPACSGISPCGTWVYGGSNSGTTMVLSRSSDSYPVFFLEGRIRNRSYLKGRIQFFSRSGFFLESQIWLRLFLEGQIQIKVFSRRTEPDPGITHPGSETLVWKPCMGYNPFHYEFDYISNRSLFLHNFTSYLFCILISWKAKRYLKY